MMCKKKKGSGQGRISERLLKFIEEYTQESDRACVIVVGARLDYLLYQILAKFLLPNTGSSDELLDPDRPLGTFSARINMAIGLV